MAEGHDGSRLRLLLGLVGLLLLAVPGFAVGLLAGVVWREPGLVATHLFGGTREVAWGGPATAGPSDASASGATGDVAAAPPKSPPAAVEREPAPIAAIDSEPTARLAVQVGAFGDAASAEKLAGTLRRKGFPAFVSPSTGDSGARWRVRVGPMTSRDEADRTAARLKSEERLPTWVIEEGRS